jgi:hypothetical protein
VQSSNPYSCLTVGVPVGAISGEVVIERGEGSTSADAESLSLAWPTDAQRSVGLDEDCGHVFELGGPPLPHSTTNVRPMDAQLSNRNACISMTGPTMAIGAAGDPRVRRQPGRELVNRKPGYRARPIPRVSARPDSSLM